MSYIEEARTRARRRKSRWNLLLIPAVLVPTAVLWASGMLVAEQVHMRYFPEESLANGEGPWIVIAAIAPLFAAIPVGMLVGNFTVHRIEAARAALDREASSDPTLGYRASRAALVRLALYTSTASLVATTVAALLPW